MLSVSYDYYQNTFLGVTLSESDFNKGLRKANYIVDNFTFGRAGKVTELSTQSTVTALKDCLCELAEKVCYYNNNGGSAGIKSSESVGAWSVGYSQESLPKSVSKDYESAVSFYLGNTNLLYMGIGGC